jgi:cytochrome b561
VNCETESAFGHATRVLAADDGTNYDKVAIALHWTTAALVLFQFVSSLIWDYVAKPARGTLESLHVSFGILLAAAILARVMWRWFPGHQRSSLATGWMEKASKAVHYVLYLLLIVQAGLGFVMGWAGGHPIHLFGLPIPGPLDALPRPVRHEIREVHEKIGYGIVILAFGHALAALYHHYILKDRVLQRMLPIARPRAGQSAD